jgi:O-methyltransferase involved in polyketide biosynthesis
MSALDTSSQAWRTKGHLYLMYLPRETVSAFMAALDVYFRDDVTLALTFMVPDARGRARFHNGSTVLSVWLDVIGEPFLSAHTPEELMDLLGRHGFPQAELWGNERLRREVLPEPLRARPLAVGEHVCVARRARGADGPAAAWT